MHIEVRNNREESRYEILEGGRVLGIADYRIEGETIVFPHTEIDRFLRGRGLGERLVRAALDDVRTSGRVVDARCWYVRQVIEENAEYRDLPVP